MEAYRKKTRLGSGRSTASSSTSSSPEEEAYQRELELKFGWDIRDHDQRVTPDLALRGCTDCIWVLLLLAAVSGVYALSDEYLVQGNPKVHMRLHNYLGQRCGFGVNAGKNYLYLCASHPHHLSGAAHAVAGKEIDLNVSIKSESRQDGEHAHAVAPQAVTIPAEKRQPRLYTDSGLCLASCPNDTAIILPCYMPKTPDDFQRTWKNLSTYRSREYAHMMCWPTTEALQPQMLDWSRNSQDFLVALTLDSIAVAWSMLVFAIVLGILGSYMFILYLRFNASGAIWACLLMLGFVLAGSGIHILHDHVDMAANSTVLNAGNVFFALVLLLLGLALFLCALCRSNSVQAAGACIQAACECFFDVPALWLEPLWSTLLLTVFIAGTTYLSLCIMSYHMTEQSDKHILLQWCDVLLVVFLLCWLQECLRSTSCFTTSYITQIWFCKGAESARLWRLFEARLYIVRYHLGSIIFGSLVIMLLRPIRTIVGVFGTMAQQQCTVLGCVVNGLLPCFVYSHKKLQPYSSSGFMDMAMNGGPYCRSCHYGLEVMLDKGSTAHVLSEATKVMQGVGFMLLGGATYGISRVVLIVQPDPMGSGTVERPVVLCLLSALVTCWVAGPFLMAFDSISDNLLYCIALHKRRLEKQAQELAAERELERGTVSTIVDTMAAPFYNLGAWLGVVREPSTGDALARMSTIEQMHGINGVTTARLRLPYRYEEQESLDDDELPPEPRGVPPSFVAMSPVMLSSPHHVATRRLVEKVYSNDRLPHSGDDAAGGASGESAEESEGDVTSDSDEEPSSYMPWNYLASWWSSPPPPAPESQS
eukprot:TRINITY_DN37927_c0_g1_i2.p1 TRINITY_DN37927_c0_g1~~TRINITY_DN37927_c0_g1_i2.p1  ORF type:complete len:818 (-),score=125.70 TRINITY_DN37927_c0_g1_i2:560-3013(-)